MTYNFLIAPDFAPERFAGWHLFNTTLQKRTELSVHLLMPVSHDEQEQMIAEQDVALIYANPFDAAALIREQGYKAVAKPKGISDEMIIAAAAEGNYPTLDALKPGCRVAMADNRDVKLIGLRLLEAVDLVEDDLHWHMTENFQAAAREVIQGKADMAFFLADVYHGLSKFTSSQLRVLVESKIADISHVLLIRDDIAHHEVLKQVILTLQEDSNGKSALEELGMTEGFEPMVEEDAEFMIDLMETLLD